MSPTSSSPRLPNPRAKKRQVLNDSDWLPESEIKKRKATADAREKIRAQNALDMTGERCRIAIDIGTTFTKACFQFSSPDSPSPENVHHVAWQSNQYETPSILTYRDGKLYWGQQVESWLKEGEIHEHTVMRQAKLALHLEETVKHVKSKVMTLLKLEGKTIYNLFADYMSALVIFIKQFISQTAAGAGYDLAKTPIELLVSVPQVWQPHSNVALTDAARKLGVYSCTIVGEALCCSSTLLEKELNAAGANRWLKEGDRVLVVDLGRSAFPLSYVTLADFLKVVALVTLCSSSSAIQSRKARSLACRWSVLLLEHCVELSLSTKSSSAG